MLVDLELQQEDDQEDPALHSSSSSSSSASNSSSNADAATKAGSVSLGSTSIELDQLTEGLVQVGILQRAFCSFQDTQRSPDTAVKSHSVF
jgi:hypothetical protein